MIGDKNKFEYPRNNEDAKVILGNNSLAKVLGKGRTKIDRYKKEADTLFVQGLNKNILCVGKMENKGNLIVFTSSKCKVIDEETR